MKRREDNPLTIRRWFCFSYIHSPSKSQIPFSNNQIVQHLNGQNLLITNLLSPHWIISKLINDAFGAECHRSDNQQTRTATGSVSRL